MPQLIRTPEQIFREEGKDIYFIRFVSECDDDEILPSNHGDPLARKEILGWLEENTPSSRTECLAPSEKSGFICGYFGDLRVDFSAADLAHFCARWEDLDGGCIDPRFQCYLWRHKVWFDEVSRYVPTSTRPIDAGISRWWETPYGIVYHQIDDQDAARRGLVMHPGNYRDIWFNFVRLCPELASLNPEGLINGSIRKSDDGSWKLIYSDGDVFNDQKILTPARQNELIEWFRLPTGTKVIHDEW